MDHSTSTAAPSVRRALNRDSLAVLAVGASFISGVWMTWGRLGNLFFDCGRELEVPRLIVEGGVLYRDVRYYWGPLAPHLNAALYSVFGVSLDTARWAGIATAALACAALYLIARSLAGRLAAVFVAIAFVHLCGFAFIDAIPIFNFVLPFNFSATYGIAAALWSVHFLLVHARTGRTSALAYSGLFLLLVALSKVEIAVALVAAHVAHAGASATRLSIRHAITYASVALFAAAVYGVFLHQAGASLWTENLAALGNSGSAHYVAVTMGLRDRDAAWQIAASLLTLGGLFGGGFLLSRRTAWGTSQGTRWIAIGGAAVVGFVLAYFVPFRYTLKSLPLVHASVICMLLYARWRAGDRALGGRWREHLVVWVFALACLARIPLRAGPHLYGFFLLPPTLVCIALLYFEYGPRLAQQGWQRRIPAAIGVGLLLGFAAAALHLSLPRLAQASVPVRGPRGQVLLPGDLPEHGLISALSGARGIRSAVAVPFGAGVLFVSGIPFARDGMTSYLPMELPDDDADARLVARWQADPPDLVLYWQKDLRADFGYVGFGEDYGVRARRWLFENYVPIQDPATGMFLMLRAPEALPSLPAP